MGVANYLANTCIKMEELVVQFSSPAGITSQHTIYCKRHSLRQQSNKTPNNRTLFTTGWPPYCGKDEVKELFSRVGHVEEVYLQERTGPVEEGPTILTGKFTFGYIVFKEEEEVTRALSLCSGVPLSCCIGDVGLIKWSTQYQQRYQTESILEAAAKKGVAAYDQWMEDERRRKKRLSEPDAEGWVTVTKKTKQVEHVKKKKRIKKDQTLKLYPFQLRETQRKRIAELRKKFQEDQQKVAEMKAKRKFKPF